MKKGFEKFVKSWGKDVIPRLSIRCCGKNKEFYQIGFNRAMVSQFKIRDFKFAVLFIDQKGKQIGIQLTNDIEAEGKHKITIHKTTGIHITCGGFFRRYKFGELKSRSLLCEFDEQDKFITAKYEEV